MAATAPPGAAQHVRSQEDLDAVRSDRVPLPLLAHLDSYDCNTFDYCTTRGDLPQRGDWLEIFRASVAGFRKVAENDEAVPAASRAQKAREFAERCATAQKMPSGPEPPAASLQSKTKLWPSHCFV